MNVAEHTDDYINPRTLALADQSAEIVTLKKLVCRMSDLLGYAQRHEGFIPESTRAMQAERAIEEAQELAGAQ